MAIFPRAAESHSYKRQEKPIRDSPFAFQAPVTIDQKTIRIRIFAPKIKSHKPRRKQTIKRENSINTRKNSGRTSNNHHLKRNNKKKAKEGRRSAQGFKELGKTNAVLHIHAFQKVDFHIHDIMADLGRDIAPLLRGLEHHKPLVLLVHIALDELAIC